MVWEGVVGVRAICTRVFLFSFSSNLINVLFREAAKKNSFHNGRAIKEKIIFLTFFSNVPKFQWPLSSRGEGVRP